MQYHVRLYSSVLWSIAFKRLGRLGHSQDWSETNEEEEVRSKENNREENRKRKKDCFQFVWYQKPRVDRNNDNELLTILTLFIFSFHPVASSRYPSWRFSPSCIHDDDGKKSSVSTTSFSCTALRLSVQDFSLALPVLSCLPSGTIEMESKTREWSSCGLHAATIFCRYSYTRISVILFTDKYFTSLLWRDLNSNANSILRISCEMDS